VKVGVVAALLASSLACRGASQPPAVDPVRELGPGVVRQYADIAFAAYQDSAEAARRLLAAVETLAARPTAANLTAARAAWLAARTPYLQTETYRFTGGPIERVELLVNTWPVDESYIESATGIVNDGARYPTLTADLLAALNVKEGETSVSTGYHAIEFLLWGADQDPRGPGNRSHLDFRAADPRAEEARRRGLYLRLVTALLLRHLEQLAADWAPAPGNYRARLLALPVREALGVMVKGMGALSGAELAGERLTVAHATKDQENEHSCFSDNTHEDIVQNAIGIQNLCLGRYRHTSGSVVSGPALCDLLARLDAGMGQRLVAQVADSVEAARAIPHPFDQAILGNDAAPGRLAVQRAITALEGQTSTLSQAAAALGIGLTVTAAVGR
jgi:putative iron-regulated protein